MKHISNDHLHRSSQGFSLIEVVMAIAIVAVGLVAILGLIPQGLKSARNAADDSLVAVIAQDTIAQRKIYILNNHDKIGTTDPNQPYYYMADGTYTNPPSANLAMFRCEVTSTKDQNLNLETTQVRILWPWYRSDLPPGSFYPLNTNVFMTAITAY